MTVLHDMLREAETTLELNERFHVISFGYREDSEAYRKLKQLRDELEPVIAERERRAIRMLKMARTL